MIPGQTSLPPEVPKKVGRLEGQTCEWCDDPAAVSIEISRKAKGARGRMSTGQFILACHQHTQLARQAATR